MSTIAIKKLDKLISSPLDEEDPLKTAVLKPTAVCSAPHGKSKRVSTEASRAKTEKYKKRTGIRHMTNQEIRDWILGNFNKQQIKAYYNDAFNLIQAAARGEIEKVNEWTHANFNNRQNIKRDGYWNKKTFDLIKEIMSGSTYYHLDENDNFVENKAPAQAPAQAQAQPSENDKYEVDPALSPESKEKREQEVIKELTNERDALKQKLSGLTASKVYKVLTKETLSSLSTEDRDFALSSIKMFIDSKKDSKLTKMKSKYNSMIDMYKSSGLVSPELTKYDIKSKADSQFVDEHVRKLEDTVVQLEEAKKEQIERLEKLKKQREEKQKNIKKIDNSTIEAGHVDAEQLDTNNDGVLNQNDLTTDEANEETLNSLIQELERSIQETENSITQLKPELQASTMSKLASQTIGKREDEDEIILDDEEEERKNVIAETLSSNEKRLYKDIELALSYFENPEFRNYTELTFKDQNKETFRHIDEPRKKQLKLVQLAISKYMAALREMKKQGTMTTDEAKEAKKSIIDKLKERYFKVGNEFAISLSGREGKDNFSFDLKEVQSAKDKRRAAKNYVNQNAPNKDTFFIYNLSDVYSIIHDFCGVELSAHSKGLIEGIVNHAVERFKREAEDSGYVAHHTIAHGVSESLHKLVKLIEKYINSRRNMHIKMKFSFSSDEREKLIDVVKKEISTREFSENSKSSNLLGRIASLRF